jgi:hypothetical protein
MSALVSQLEAGLKRHREKAYVPAETIYEDSRIVVKRRGGSMMQFNKLQPGQKIAVLLRR